MFRHSLPPEIIMLSSRFSQTRASNPKPKLKLNSNECTNVSSRRGKLAVPILETNTKQPSSSSESSLPASALLAWVRLDPEDTEIFLSNRVCFPRFQQVPCRELQSSLTYGLSSPISILTKNSWNCCCIHTITRKY